MDYVFSYVLKRIDYQHIVAPKDVAFRRDLWAWSYSRLTTITSDNAHLDLLLDTSASCMEHFFPSACHQSRMCTGTTTAAALLADDSVKNPDALEQLHHFSQRYLRGLQQPEGLCAALADGIKNSDEFYGSKSPRVGNIAVMSGLGSMDGMYEESKFPQRLPRQFAGNCSRYRRTEWSVEKLPGYFRYMSGGAEAYLPTVFKPSHDVEVPLDFWISAIPDLSQFQCIANDLFSFPEEVLALENINYFSLITRARRQTGRISLFDSKDGLWTFRDTHYEACDQLFNCIAALDKLFITFAESLSEEFDAAQTRVDVNGQSEEKENISSVDKETLENARLASKIWCEFRQGFIAWHINEPRYRLTSIRATLGGSPDAR